MIIASWNINGIRARKETLRAWVESRQPDLLVLQEVKAPEEDIPEEIRALAGYRKFWNGSVIRKGYSGTGILMREGSIGGEAAWEIPPFDIENRTAVLHMERFTLIGTYVPRGESEAHYRAKLDYLENLRAYAESLLQSGRQVILAGDMNVAHRDIDVHRSQNKPGAVGLRPEERAAIGAQIESGLSDIMRDLNPSVNNLFTWWPYWKMARERNLGWRIDCIYLSGGLVGKVAGSRVDLDEKSSDHAPVIVELTFA
ncbi:MAG: exodeoxyribonuclease III [Chlorobiaceae bacterium]|nr:exodeoxyribonuclease III [Chlorobiaceae bacterium]NTV61547.1 exodeoxyribonuclease III [Chlorobiaceae bacterium]